jgi:glutamine synthetase
MRYKAEYIWSTAPDRPPSCGRRPRSSPTAPNRRSGAFDGSSTNQAEGHASDRVLKPVASFPDPIRGRGDVLVMCEVYHTDDTPHESNTRAALREVAELHASQESLFGIEQEYTFFQGSRPLSFPDGGYPAPQGGYYCGVGADEICGRAVVEKHLEYCLAAGLALSGINAEVMPGQWEFQVGPLGPLDVADQLWVARWLLYRTAEDAGLSATLDPKPAKGDWNGAGAHTNFSTKRMRESYDAVIEAAEALGRDDKPMERTSRTTGSASRPASPARTRPPRGTSTATASPTAALRCASRGRSRRSRRATSRTAARTQTSTRTW